MGKESSAARIVGRESRSVARESRSVLHHVLSPVVLAALVGLVGTYLQVRADTADIHDSYAALAEEINKLEEQVGELQARGAVAVSARNHAKLNLEIHEELRARRADK